MKNEMLTRSKEKLRPKKFVQGYECSGGYVGEYKSFASLHVGPVPQNKGLTRRLPLLRWRHSYVLVIAAEDAGRTRSPLSFKLNSENTWSLCCKYVQQNRSVFTSQDATHARIT
ncbi:uncharacterized [Tachysurus ichikawai]